MLTLPFSTHSCKPVVVEERHKDGPSLCSPFVSLNPWTAGPQTKEQIVCIYISLQKKLQGLSLMCDWSCREEVCVLFVFVYLVQHSGAL